MSKVNPKKMKIAVIGGGISGLSCAWCLSAQHSVTLFERDSQFGGHAKTVFLKNEDDYIPIDVGFIVYNQRNYPNLVALFNHLGVRSEQSNMSFSFSNREQDLEYEGSLRGFLTQPQNLLKKRYRKMLFDIFRFFRKAEEFLDNKGATSLSLKDYLEIEKYSDGFIYDHLLPMGASIWSAKCSDMLSFPAETFINFFKNHALLELGARPKWMTVSGGSVNYVNNLLSTFAGIPKLNCRVDSIERDCDGLIVEANNKRTRFDTVVFACHADQALEILGEQATNAQRKILSSFRYAENLGVLHRDPALMPDRRRAWASWNFISDSGVSDENIEQTKSVCVTYWMNKLQNIKSPENLFVTLNPTQLIEKNKIIDKFKYAHPQFDRKALAGQRDLPRIQGQGGLWFCGSYCGNGFHEDGLRAGLEVAEALGSPAPWCTNAIPGLATTASSSGPFVKADQ
ncbi:MAG: FAD-dependent oxidoreductase [Pseudomonadota bacterium]|nr:FAD-dependent oxidoreductase [Pseudomonadota bacterium]